MNKIFFVSVIFLAIIFTSCFDVPEPTLETQSLTEDGYLPVGTIVPAGKELTALPEYYDPDKHGPALPDASQNNLLEDPAYVPPPKRVPPTEALNLQTSSMPYPGDGDRGFWLYSSPYTWYGAGATHDVQLNVSLPPALPGRPAVYLFAPTFMPPSGSCVEAATIHQRDTGTNVTYHEQGWFDWCNGSGTWGLIEKIDQAFRDKYVRNYQGEGIVSISIVTPNDPPFAGQCWFGHLYNFQLGGWVQKVRYCGNSATIPIHGTRGWTIWESWYLMDNGACPSLPSIRAQNIVVYHPTDVNDRKKPFTNYPNSYGSLGPYGSCWTNGTYTFSQPAPGLSANSWIGKTPNP